MSFSIFFVMLFLIVLPLGIFLRFVDLGLKPGWALKMLFRFPKEIIEIHYLMYKKIRNKDRRLAIKLLFAPFISLPSVLISYAEMYIDAYAKLIAVKELLTELDDKEIRKLTKLLKKQGIVIKRHKVKRMDVIDDAANVDTYAEHLGLSNLLGVY